MASSFRLCGFVLAALALPGAAAAAGWSERAVRSGIAVTAEITPLASGPGGLREGEGAAFRFAISDTATGQPLAGLSPAAWMERVPEDAAFDEEACLASVKELVGGSILKKPELNLNVYYVLALNQDASVSVVDPLFGFGGSKLLAMVNLLSPGEDWALTADQKRLFISQPEAGRVAVVDTASWKVTDQLDAGEHPTRLALQPDGAYLWVALDSGVAAVDVRGLRIAARIPTGAGRHEIAFSDDSALAFVTNRDADTLSVVDVRALRKVKDVATGSKPVSVDWSAPAQRAYVTHEGDGAIVAVDRQSAVAARMQAAPGLGQIRFAPGGRLGFAVNPRLDTLSIVDAATNRIVQTGTMRHGPDQVTFSDDLAYVRHLGSETVLMIPLKEVGEEGRPVPAADFPGGQFPFGRGKRPSPAAGLVRAPGATSMLVANPADQVIYYYKEGMAAPMGSFKNYDREPRAVLVVDRSLSEASHPGTYETVANLGLPGRYKVAFFLDSPRFVHCFRVDVQADPVLEAARRAVRPARVEPLPASAPAAVGQAVPLRFRLTDPNTGDPLDGLNDVQVLIYRTDSNGQQREAARAVGQGLYEARFTPSRPGPYIVRVECPSRHLSFFLSPQVILQVSGAGS
jgi:DNA-binding beta-propeller fold protein YncE